MQRAVFVYLPSMQQKDRWKVLAKQQGTSVSKFVIEHVENSLQQADPAYKSRGDLWNEVAVLREQLDKALQTNRVLEIAIERLEAEARRYRAQPFLKDSFTGIRQYQKELIAVLRTAHRPVESTELLSRLGIALTEHEAVQAISKQLEYLEDYGLVQSSPKGWKWLTE